ncbi:MAG: ATP-dependent RNA helicase HrpA [Planctomycetaceae bacterium]|jgi:ATP-dependent helicase HrpA|nr:ATP-dependent RNA helicase HrpA [Planctomycetaceae bacterium]
MSAADLSLPILQHREQIANLINQNQTVVICGETGSGKSTQLPKLCLEMGRGKKLVIGHTQPRRIAARSVAARIADELQIPLGTTVGYKIRFQDQTAPETRIKLMTDGILLAESQNDRLFRRYDTIIIDEAHERSLNIDFLLGMMKRVLPKRPDLKLIITSATIDATRFAQHFADQNGKPAPVIEVAGRTYPIETFYRPLNETYQEDETENDTLPDIYDAVTRTVGECIEIGHGDILIFMPTERDILETAKHLRAASFPARERKLEILPLYARLSTKEQQRIFQNSPHRKIVIATNVAESSLTVPGIRFVIDTGTARISRYSGRTKTQRLPIDPVSQSSADQRAGRCGRCGAGVCFRLYEKSDYEKRPRYTTPEIQRTNLASVILQTLSLKLGAIERFPFLDPPQSQAIKDGYKTLREIGAIDSQGGLTNLGIRLSKLPVDPRIGRMILAAEEENCLADMLVIAAVLEIQDPRERPFEQREKADTAHEKFANPESDFLAYLNLWNFYQHLKSTLSQNQLRKACTQNFINYNRMREWTDIHIQLLSIWHETKNNNPPLTTKSAVQTTDNPQQTDYNSLHRSILTGFLSGIANRDDSENKEYNAVGGKFLIWPGSGMVHQKKKHQWIVAVERVETTRRYLRTVACIDPAWIEPLAEHLLQRTITEPHWNSETGYVHAYEKVTLFGLTIIPKRRVNFGTLRPKEAREIFIQSALVDGDFTSTIPFVIANENLVNEVLELQDKFRRPDLLTDTSARYEFYNLNLPQEVYDRDSLEKFWKTATGGQRQSLFMSIDLLCRLPVNELMLASFPNKLQTITGDIPLNYKYEPGEQDDGITVIVSRETLNQLTPTQLSWLVPGMLEEKITTLLRNLPKEIRRQIVPIPDTVKKILPEFQKNPSSDVLSRETLEAKLATIITRVAGRRVTATDFNEIQLPTELKMNIRVVDEQGKTIKESRDLKELKNELQVKTTNTLPDSTDPKWNRDNITAWDFGTLPESIECERNGFKIRVNPTLAVQPETKTVSLRLCDNQETANKLTIESLIYLFYQHKKFEIETQIRWLPNVEKLKIYATQLTNSAGKFNLKQDVGLLIANRAVEPERIKIPRTKEEYKTFLTNATQKIPNAVTEITKLLEPLLTSYHQAKLALEKLPGKFQSAKEDTEQNLENLTTQNFLQTTNWQSLQNYPRYFKAVAIRLEKLTSGGLTHDTEAAKELQALQQRYNKIKSEQPANTELENLRWMLEEYRVSLFAQKLGTQMKISAQRIEKQFEKVNETL